MTLLEVLLSIVVGLLAVELLWRFCIWRGLEWYLVELGSWVLERWHDLTRPFGGYR